MTPDRYLASSVIPLRQSAVEASLKQAAFDHLPLAAVCINGASQLLAVNAATAELLQIPAADLVGRHLSELLTYTSARAAARRWARFWARLHSHGSLSTLARLPLPAGRRMVLQLDAELLRFEQESVALITLRDAQAVRAGMRGLRHELSRARALLEATDGATLMLGADRRVLVAHGVRAALPELAHRDLLGIPFELLLDDASSVQFVEASTQAHTHRARFTWRLRGLAGGPGRWLAATLTHCRDRQRLQCMVLHLRSAEDELAARAKTDRLERRLRLFVDAAADALMLVDAQGVVRFQSNAVRGAFGLAPEQTTGRPLAALVADGDRGAVAEAVAKAVREGADGGAVQIEADFHDAQGAPCRVQLTFRNFLDEPALGGVLVAGHRVVASAIGAGQQDGKRRTPARPELARPDQTRRLEFREQLLELAMQTRGDFAQSLSRLLRATAQTLGTAGASFWRRTADGRVLQCEALFDLQTDRFAREWVGVELRVGDEPAYFAQIDQRQPVVLKDTRVAALGKRFVEDARWVDVRSAIDVPVLLDGEVKGVLSVHDSAPRAWDEDEINFVSTAALMTALAIEAAQRQDAEGRIEQLAWYDSLTGLPNRNLLRETMRDLVMTAANRRRRIAVMLIDLDRFKDVNDTLGHLVGDALIKSVAQVLRETVGSAGLVARLGGDEFVVLVNEFEHRQEVALLAARLAQALHRTDFVPNVDTQVSASIGVALFPEHGREMSTLLKNADAAMYQAKRDGRNQFSFFNPIRHERAAREVQLGIQLLKAVQADAAQFIVDYQPQVEMASGRVVGLEALIRWQHPTFGLLTPDRFIGVAELSGLSERITRWVVNEVCAQIVRWRNVLPAFDIPVAVNVAGREMGSVALPAIVRGALQRHGVEPAMLVLEITERTLVREGEINNDVMNELVSLGVGLVLDDFGTGYSMLGYLKRMPIQALKVDQSFVVGVPEDADSRAIVRAMVAVASHFRLKVVAEGIETPEQVDYLRSIGCEYAQGYYYSRPLPPQTIVDYVQRGRA
jgi:diguanylate cyclase (GGDEF)-like protein/PAS domain S-box-containing protein